MIKLPKPIWLGDIYGHSDATLKQAVRDALELARDAVEELSYDASRGDCADAIRALIKEIA